LRANQALILRSAKRVSKDVSKECSEALLEQVLRDAPTIAGAPQDEELKVVGE